MKTALCLAFLLASIAGAAEPTRSAKIQTGRMSTIHLLATGRVTQGAPDGVRFLFMVTPNPGISGAPTIKETRDFLIAGNSYQERTQAEIGRRIEPETVLDSASGFFKQQPGARRLAPEKIDGAHILAISIRGAKLEAGERGEIGVSFGFNKEVEPFTFAFVVPPRPGDAKGPSRPN